MTSKYYFSNFIVLNCTIYILCKILNLIAGSMQVIMWKRKSANIEEITTYCVYQGYYQPSICDMIQCSKCNVWYHGICMNVDIDKEKDNIYVCQECLGVYKIPPIFKRTATKTLLVDMECSNSSTGAPTGIRDSKSPQACEHLGSPRHKSTPYPKKPTTNVPSSHVNSSTTSNYSPTGTPKNALPDPVETPYASHDSSPSETPAHTPIPDSHTKSTKKSFDPINFTTTIRAKVWQRIKPRLQGL